MLTFCLKLDLFTIMSQQIKVDLFLIVLDVLCSC